MLGSNQRSRDEFEQLLLLRRCYPWRSDYDACQTLSVAEAILYGEQLMRLARVANHWTGYGPARRAA